MVVVMEMKMGKRRGGWKMNKCSGNSLYILLLASVR